MHGTDRLTQRLRNTFRGIENCCLQHYEASSSVLIYFSSQISCGKNHIWSLSGRDVAKLRLRIRIWICGGVQNPLRIVGHLLIGKTITFTHTGKNPRPQEKKELFRNKIRQHSFVSFCTMLFLAVTKWNCLEMVVVFFFLFFGNFI